ncbi:FAD-dependent oxidoreductase [Mesorhizobium sp. M0047]|uniref:FAD-dependent oxidoreductase n=1 Tax=Mesorhizobium sp. M0047 TaxID=2956859 RepID=UPI00333529F5
MYDVVVVGSGVAALTAALTVSASKKTVLILEKSDQIGGTSAMSAGMTWIPANHYMTEAGLRDSPAEALDYIRAVAPPGWASTEDALWQAQAENAAVMLRTVESNSPLRFKITDVSDPNLEATGSKAAGRLLSPKPISRKILGSLGRRIRKSTIPLTLTYHERVAGRILKQPIRGIIRYSLTLLSRRINQVSVMGNAMVVGLLKGCLDKGCVLKTSSRVTDLIIDPASSAVVGVKVDQNGTACEYGARQGVVLATGGFEWDSVMLAKHFPVDVEFMSSPPTNEGDGHKMAAAAGAAFAYMDQANVNAQPPVIYEGRIHGIAIKFHTEPDAIIVDASGKRFCSEYEYYISSRLVEIDAKTQRPKHQPAWVISHRPMLKRNTIVRFFHKNKAGWLVAAPTIKALARKIGVDGDTLEATVSRFNGFAKAGQDPEFGRGVASIYEKKLAADVGLMASIDKPPFIAIRFQASVIGTKGGVRTDRFGQATKPDGSLIPGLYCAGGTMANPTGTRAPSQHGTTLGPYMTWAYICAQGILRQNR